MLSRLNRRAPIICKDGFSMSVQASNMHYCTPKINGDDVFYKCVEVGFPSEAEAMLAPYAEDPSDLLNTVYPYVPAVIIKAVVAAHGGLLAGELPKLALGSDPDSIDYYDVDVDENGPFLTVSFNSEEE